MEPGTPVASPSPASTTISLTIPYVVVVPNGNPVEETDRWLANLCEEAAASQHCSVSYARGETTSYVPSHHHRPMMQHTYIITVVGGMREAISTRGTILRNNLTQTTVSIKASRRFLMVPGGGMKASAKRRLDNIMRSTQCHLTVLGQNLPKVPGPSYRESHDVVDIEITGVWEAVERARIETLVFLDETTGLFADTAEIDPKLHQSLAGRKRSVLKQIMQDTMTNIYLPSPFAFQPSREGNVALEDREKILIWITGDRYGVQMAKEALLRHAEAKKAQIVSRSAACAPRKIDWILMNRKDALRKILQDNGAFVVFPPLGIHHNVITVFGDDRVYVERTLRQIMLLTTGFYVSCIQLSQPAFNLLGPGMTTAVAGEPVFASVARTVQAMLSHVALTCRAEIVLKSNFVEIFGTDLAVKSAFEQLVEIDAIKMYTRDTKFQLELAVEHHEFISGKKNGKVNKIVRSSGCRVTFQENYNGYNMLVDILNPYPSKALEGLALLEEELPAELSFCVPEAFHKRIIGVGGKNIQRIMKKFGVYVKFSNAEEFAELGGYFENEDNVIARTPAKNANNLESLKLVILDLVNNAKEMQDVEVPIHIPREFHRTVAGRGGYNIREIEKRTRVTAALPEKESGSGDIVLKGPEQYISQAKAMLQDIVPEITAIYVKATPRAREVLMSDEFLDEIALRAKQSFDVDLLPYVPRDEEDVDQVWVVMEHRKASQTADEGRKWVLEYLAGKKLEIEQVDQAQRTPAPEPPSMPITTAAEAFQHFNSKLFAPVQPSESPSYSYSLFDTEGFKAARGVGSAPNLRSLFDESSKAVGGMRRSQSELVDNLFMDAIVNRNRRLTESSLESPAPSLYGTYDSPTTFFPPPAPFGQRAAEESSTYISDSPPRLVPRARTDSSDEGTMSPGNPSMRAWSPPRSNDRAPSPPRRGSPLRSYTPIEEIFESPDPSDAEDIILSDDLINRVLRMGMAEAEEEPTKHKEYAPVRIILESLNLQKFVDHFIEQEIDFGTFKHLDDADLRTLGVNTLGSRKRILAAIKSISQSPIS
ncbi:hypothetical protein DFJ74DRAFT_672201 [Hyaloraphidium curvatum]|nr:hypothetical protein DFJ74DRAFT_672201 [Hyaloraphidium curvatum]